MDLYQALVAVNPVTLIAQIGNLLIQMIIAKVFFLDKVKAVLDRRQEAVDREIAEARDANQAAAAAHARSEDTLRSARVRADALIRSAGDSAALRSEEILRAARDAAARHREKAEQDILREKQAALRDARNEVSGLALAIAEKVLERELDGPARARMVDRFIEELGDSP